MTAAATQSDAPIMPTVAMADDIELAVPMDLQEHDQWVLWRYDRRGDDVTKVPCSVRGRLAKANDPRTWASFEEALAAYRRGGFAGIGFVFSADDPFAGVDLDDCRDGDGELDDRARGIVESFGTYTEVSPSGSGVKMLCRADAIPKGKNVGWCELYTGGRFFTITGQRVPGTPAIVNDCSGPFAALYARVTKPKASTNGTAYRNGRKASNGDDNRVARCMAYLPKLPRAVSGSGGHNATFTAACTCFRFGLTEAETAEGMRWYNDNRCDPPWSDWELHHKVESARDEVTAAGDVGKFLREDRSNTNGQHTNGRKVNGTRRVNGHRVDTDTGEIVTDRPGGYRGEYADVAEPTVYLRTDDPRSNAEHYLADHDDIDDAEPELIRVDGDWYAYAHTPIAATQRRGWHPIKPDAMKARVWKYLAAATVQVKVGDSVAEKPFRPRPHHVEDVVTALAALRHSAFNSPAWLDGAATPEPATLIIGRNGYLDPFADTLQVRPLTPRLYAINALDFDIDTAATRPTAWLAFLDSLNLDDDELDLLQQWFGYCLTADTRQQKGLMLIGPKRCGKGTLGRILTALVGEYNVGSPTLASLASNFGLSGLIDKRLAIIGDARLSGRTDTAIVTERILSITGEDHQQVDRKHRDPVSVKLDTRLMLLTNELPRMADSSGALASRFLILPFRESFYGREDLNLEKRIRAELPGVLLWAIEGLRRLRDRGRFVQTQRGAELQQQMEDLASPVGAFVREWCDVDTDASVPARELYTAWRKFAEAEGKAFVTDAATFGRDLLAAVPSVRKRRLSEPSGSRVWHYAGIDLNGTGRIGGMA